MRYFDETHQAAVVEIKDNGSGIDEADMPHIFNPFFTRKNYGTGLGLSLVKKIIDLHQGKIDISVKRTKERKFVLHCLVMKGVIFQEINPATWNPLAPVGRGMSRNPREVALL